MFNNLGGIFMPRISTIDQKIEALIEWNRKYPFAKMVSNFYIKNPLRYYAHSEEEYKTLSDQFLKMQKYYDYVTDRKSRGKLAPSLEKMCKEGNIRGVFGYPSTTEALSQKYGLKPGKIDYILCKYNTIEDFMKAYKEGRLDKQDMYIFEDNFANLCIDYSTGTSDPHIVSLLQAISGDYSFSDKKNLRFYDTAKLIEVLGKLNEKEENIIKFRLGICDGKPHTLEETFQQFGLSGRERVKSLERKALRQLRALPSIRKSIYAYIDSDIQDEDLTPEEKTERASILDKIFNSNFIFLPDNGFTQASSDITPSALKDMASSLLTIKENIANRKPKPENTALQNIAAQKSRLTREAKRLEAQLQERKAELASTLDNNDINLDSKD